MSANTKLYIVSIPGPDEIYAAPSHKVAQLMKAAHDKLVNGFLAERHAKGESLWCSPEDMHSVVEECDDPKEHAELLEEFSYADWGITEDDLIEPEGTSQAQLFAQEGGAA